MEPIHLQRLSERWINNGNYFKTNWNQKVQPSSVTARQKGKPQKEEISALNIVGTPVSSSRQIFSTFLGLQSQVQKTLTSKTVSFTSVEQLMQETAHEWEQHSCKLAVRISLFFKLIF